jgi:hypothetical protein
VIIMPIRGRAQAASLAAVVAAGVTGCTGPAITGAQHTASPAPRATAVVPAGSPRSPEAASPGTRAAPGCRRRQLKIRIIHGGPAAGTVGADIGFINDGSTPCRLAGWPALMAVGPAGRAAARRTLAEFAGPALTRPPVVTISPGARAVAVLAGPDAPVPGATTCPPPYRWLRVTLPGDTRATVISAWIPSSGDVPACGRIEISPVVPARIGWPGGGDQH